MNISERIQASYGIESIKEDLEGNEEVAVSEILPENTLSEVLIEEDGVLSKIEQVNVLLDKATALEKMQIALLNNSDVIDQDAMPLIKTIVNQTCVGIPQEGTVFLSQEAFQIDFKEAYEISVENIGDFIKSAWKALLKLIKTIKENLWNFIKKLFGYNRAIERKGQQNALLIKQLPAEVPSEIKDPFIKLDSRQTKVLTTVSESGKVMIPGDGVLRGLDFECEKMRQLIVSGLSEFTKNQLKGNAATQNIMDGLLVKARSDLERGRKKDSKIADGLTSYAARKLDDAMGVLNKQRKDSLIDFQGLYFGGVFVKNDPAVGFFFINKAKTPTPESRFNFLDRQALSQLNGEAMLLSAAIDIYCAGDYEELKDKLESTLLDFENAVDELAADYSDFPIMVNRFNEAINESVKEHNNLLESIFRIIKAASEASSLIISEIVPANISYLNDTV